MNLLLDACTLIRLVHSEAYGQYLMALENYVQNGNISLLTHQCVIKEWESHKEGNRKRIVKKIAKQHQLPVQSGGDLLPAPITIDHIDLQYQQIDRLLQGATMLFTPDQINFEFAGRYRDRLAPFHNKLDSQNDWELFGSAGLYCERNDIQQLYFVSWNDTDFADPTEKNRTLHPDLQVRFPKVKIWYFREIEDFLGQLSQLILPDHLLSYNIVRNEKFSYKASVRKHELDSLFHLWHNIYSEVAFIPPHLLKKYHPFAKPAGGYTYYSIFSMNEVRQELVEMFEGVEINNEGIRIIKPEMFTGVKGAQEKIEYVLLRMTNNLIFRLSSKGAKTVNVRYHGNIHCDCMRCAYQRLEWHNSLKELKKPQEDLQERLKQAYFYYQFGNYSAAARAFLALRDEAEKNKKYIIYFICLYNLHHLGSFLSNIFYPHNLTAEDIAELKAIDPIEHAVKLKSHTDYDLLIYIADGNFFKDSFDTIVKNVTQIEDNYYSFLRGGWSSNNLVQLLIVEFAELETLMSRDFIVYDAYSNWDRLFEQITKGLFASHAMRNSESSALQTFDDYLVSMLVFNGERKTIYKYFNRYRLKDLAYKQTNQDAGFFKLALNFLGNELQIREELNFFGEEMGGRFSHRFNEVFKNLMAMASILEVSAFDIEIFAHDLLAFLKNEKLLDRFGWESVGDFIGHKGKHLSQRLKDSYMVFFVKKLKNDDHNNIEELLRDYERGRIKDAQHKKIITYIFKPNLQGGGYANKLHLMTLLLQKSDASQKIRIAVEVKKCLSKHFEFMLFYHSTIYELIPLDRRRVLILFDEINLEQKRYSLRSISTGGEDQYIPRLDELLNICFKYNIDLLLPQIVRMKDAGSYYAWLIDMNGFDYSNFPFEWVSRYKTDYYYKAMAKSKILKTEIIKYLKNNSDPALESSLIKMSFYAKKG